jgi:hypothetical protein
MVSEEQYQYFDIVFLDGKDPAPDDGGIQCVPHVPGGGIMQTPYSSTRPLSARNAREKIRRTWHDAMLGARQVINGGLLRIIRHLLSKCVCERESEPKWCPVSHVFIIW